MTPQEIAQASQQSARLKQALSVQKQTLYRFLREKVEIRPDDYKDCFPQHTLLCEKCDAVTSHPFLSPYSAPYSGWCMDCVLRGFWDGLPDYKEVEAQRKYEELTANAVICWEIAVLCITDALIQYGAGVNTR